jgi:biopolymer transport protein ExbD
MAFNNKSDQEAMSEINVTPLVDVMLVLLVVFIVTAPLLTQSVKINLPKTVSTTPAPQDHLAIVTIDSAGEIQLNSQKIGIDDLGRQLAELLARDSELTVQFNADDKINYGLAAQVMAVIQQVGITKLSLMTRGES